MIDRARIPELEERIQDLKKRLPKHSVPAAMLVELEDLEDELAELREEASQADSNGSGPSSAGRTASSALAFQRREG